ncbi:MAG: HD domain-containing protein [Synergistales bacterium]
MNEVQEWFRSFTGEFAKDDGSLEPLLALKLHHSYRVSGEAERIARKLGYDSALVTQAEVLGLLHDVGRFPQYRDFGTFYDAASVDHGELGWETVSKSGVLQFLEEGSRLAILDGIRYHNKKEIPLGVRPESLDMVRLVRDADKLDVFELVQRYLEEGRIRELLPRIPETGKISGDLLKALAETGRASYSQVASMADFLLVQLSWVFDLNYGPSFQRILDRRVIERIENRLPAEPCVRSIIEKARGYARSFAVERGRP